METKTKIICPECSTLQDATVKHTTTFFSTYLHECDCCNYVIMESEFCEVEQVKKA